MSNFNEYKKINIMKKFLLASMVFILGIALQSHGQHFLDSWEEYEWSNGPDSAKFFRLFGSVGEYNYQQGRYDRESRGKRIQFIDAKANYAFFFVDYLYRVGVCGNSVEYEELDNKVVFRVGGCNVGLDIHPMFVYMHMNKEGRIAWVEITGAPQHLIPAFKNQWWVSDQDMLGVYKGGKLTITRLDETVTFDWTKKEPRIIVKSSGANNLKRINEKQKQ